MLDHLADLESDFSRFHQIHDMYTLDGPRFMRLAWRVSCYGGVIAMRLETQNTQQQHPPPLARRERPAAGQGTKVLDLAAFMANHPGVIERVKPTG